MAGCHDLEKHTVKKVAKPLHLILFVINILFPGFGTIISGIIGESGCHGQTIIVGIVQMLTAWFIVGWIWSIWWGFLIFKKSE